MRTTITYRIQHQPPQGEGGGCPVLANLNRALNYPNTMFAYNSRMNDLDLRERQRVAAKQAKQAKQKLAK